MLGLFGGIFGLFWGILGYFGVFWGSLGVFWEIFGLFGAILEYFGDMLGYFELFWVMLGYLGGIWGYFCGICLLILFSFAGVFVSESKGAFLVFFKISIISFVLCVKARYAFCHVFVFFGTWIWTL